MICRNKDIKELLPPYLGQELEPAEARVVEAHLALCGDCQAELSLLKLMSGEEIPDPGPAFWAEMPGRIEREIRQQQRKKEERSPGNLLAGCLVPRWPWAPAAAAAAVVLITWLAFRPMPADLPQVSSHEEYAEHDEPVNVAELTTTQLAAASQWAQNQMAPIGQAINEDVTENLEQDSSEDISDLNSEELDRLEKMLRERELEVKKRIRQKQGNDKNIG